MVNVDVKEYKIKIGEEECTFRLDFKALLKFNSRYENAMIIFNEFLAGKNIFDCVVKILSCSCVEKEFTEDELNGQLGFSFGTMKLIDEIAFSLAEGLIIPADEKGNKNKKN